MFISFEGLDFCGKSTQVALLVKYLEGVNKKIMLLREPGGTVISEKVREILLDKKHDRMFIESEILLFSASRAQLVREVIRPALLDGCFVISDRFFDSTTAYQGFGRNIPVDFVKTINSFAVGETIPDITFFIDIPVDEIHKRKGLRNSGSLDRIESSDDSFYENVRKGYISLSESEDRFIRLDGLREIDEIHNEIVERVKYYV
ncbi:MAG: dTMP kinase [Bacteroidota bacterium]